MTGSGSLERLPVLVVGLGQCDRGDDAVGVVVARAVDALALAGVDVLVHEDPTALIESWSGRRLAVVVDAVRSGSPAGTLRVLETGAAAAPLPESAWAGTGRGGTHAFGLAAAVELARALGRLPQRLVVVGVEAVAFDYGAPLSPGVAAAVPAAVDGVVDEVVPAISRERSDATVDSGGSRVPR
jgi:hydrogenase maturation protease